MMTHRFCALLSSTLCAVLITHASVATAAYSDVYAGRERVLMLGDSITFLPDAIGWQVQEAFAGLANVHVNAVQFGDTDNALSEASPGVTKLESWLAGETWDVIDFNTGLHDMRPDKHDAPASYATKLGLVIDELQAHSGDATLIWRETTFVPNPSGGRELAVDGTAQDKVHLVYNAAAAPVVAAKGITIVDEIAALSATAPRVAANNVHYTVAGSRMLARPVIANVFTQLDIESGLRVDFGKSGVSPANLEGDFYDYAIAQSGSASSITRFVATDLGDSSVVEVTVATSNGSAMDARDPVDDGSAELTAAHAALGEDFVFSAVGANLIVTISGLKAGEYTFTGFAHDVTVDQGTIDVSIDTDGAAGAAAALVLDDKAYTTGSGAQVPASYGFDFTADGTNDVVITLDGTNATVLNGFKIAIKMPTPTALPLGYIALCVVVARRF